MTWSGDYAVAASRAAEAGLDINLGYTIPAEGGLDWYDLLYTRGCAAPGQRLPVPGFHVAPGRHRPGHQLTGYANANASATSLVDPEIAADPAIYPDAATRQRLHASQILAPKLERRRSRTWIKIKSGL
ncbi:MAG: hypothetical protein R3E50_13270 [Halioglobus sp.]